MCQMECYVMSPTDHLMYSSSSTVGQFNIFRQFLHPMCHWLPQPKVFIVDDDRPLLELLDEFRKGASSWTELRCGQWLPYKQDQAVWETAPHFRAENCQTREDCGLHCLVGQLAVVRGIVNDEDRTVLHGFAMFAQSSRIKV